MVTPPLYPNGCDQNSHTRKSGRPELIFLVGIEFTELTIHVFDPLIFPEPNVSHGKGVSIYHPDKRLDSIHVLQCLSASVMEGSWICGANPLADELKYNIT
jgi:hypothetical protein